MSHDVSQSFDGDKGGTWSRVLLAVASWRTVSMSCHADCSRIYEFISRGIVSADRAHTSHGVHIKHHPLVIRETEARRALEASEHEKRRVNAPDENESIDSGSCASSASVGAFLSLSPSFAGTINRFPRAGISSVIIYRWFFFFVCTFAREIRTRSLID